MPMDPQAQGPQPQEAQGGKDPMTEMIISIDQSLTQLSQVIGQRIPEAGQALEQLNEQYRQIIQAVMEQAQGGGGRPQPRAQEMASPEVGARGRQAQQAM